MTTQIAPPACPLCHAPRRLTDDELDARGAWQCATCGQQWDRRRLETVAAYAAWTAAQAGAPHA